MKQENNFSKPEYDPKDVAFNQRKVTGYKLVKPEYKEAVKAIIKNDQWFNKNWDLNLKERGFNFASGEDSTAVIFSLCNTIKIAGVMHWFEEIYETKTITLKSGVKLSEDDIAEVKEILNNK